MARWFTAALALYGFIAGVLTLIGWFASIPRLTDWIGNGIPMYANTAVAAIGASIGILMRLTPSGSKWTRVFGAFVSGIGGLTFFQHLSGINLGIDTLLITPPWEGRATVSPGRMGPPASLCFTLLGFALWLSAGHSRFRRVAPGLAIPAVAISLLAVIGYLFGADPLFAVAKVTGIALQTATIILALALALLGSLPEHDPMATICRNNAASLLARRALPFVFAFPIGCGWLFVAGRQAQLFDRGMDTAMLVLALIACFCALLWWCIADVATYEKSSRLAELELQRRNKQLATFLETAAIGLHHVGPDGIILWANEAEMRMLGYSPAEYIGRPIADFHADANEGSKILQRLACGEKLYGYEARLRCKDGSLKTVLIDSSVLWEEGKFVHTQCFTRDITELKAAEAALRDSEQRFRGTFNQAAVGIALADLDGRFMETNQKFSDILGYPPDELRSLTVLGLTHPDDLPQSRQNMARLKGGEINSYAYEKRFLHKDGGWIWILATVTLIKDRAGQPQRYIGVIQDIGERKRAEQNAARLAAIVEYSEDAIFSMDIDGRIQSWNGGAERLYGYTAAEVIRQPVTILVPEGLQSQEQAILERIRQGHPVDSFETVRRRKNGTIIDLSVTVSPIKDSHGNVIGISKVARDITEKVRAREILEKTVAERTASLREALAQMEEFSYSVSHDLRAPLRAMSAFSGLLLEDYGDRLDETARDYIQRIQRSSERMNRLTQDVLAYSRVARSQVQLEPVNLDALVRDVIYQYSNLQPPSADIEIRSPLATVMGHETTLGQCVANLLNNSVKFVAPGIKPHITIRTEPLNGRVRIWFEDNGIGIKPEYQDRVFQMFERVHPESSYDGTGIGLAIVRKAVEKMGGVVAVESDGVNGCRFWIELPAA